MSFRGLGQLRERLASQPFGLANELWCRARIISSQARRSQRWFAGRFRIRLASNYFLCALALALARFRPAFPATREVKVRARENSDNTQGATRKFKDRLIEESCLIESTLARACIKNI